MEGKGALKEEWVMGDGKGKGEEKGNKKKGEKNVINKVEWICSKIKHTGHKRQNLVTYTLELSCML